MSSSITSRGILVALLLSCPLTSQEEITPSRYQVLARRALEGPDRKEAQAELQAAVQDDYRGVHSAWRVTSDPRLKTCLRHMLFLPSIDEAEVVLRGRIAKFETIQGGVIDYHHVVVWFEDLKVVKAPAELREVLERNGTFLAAQGTSRDSWVCAVIRRDLERVQGVSTWAFRAHDYRPAAKGEEGFLRIQEYTVLPAAAADVLKQ